MKRSRGRVSRKSRLIGRRTRKRKTTVAERMKKFEVGAKVQLVPKGRFEDFPHPRYAGRVGKIIRKQGDAYIVEVRIGGIVKRFITSPVHLKSV